MFMIGVDEDSFRLVYWFVIFIGVLEEGFACVKYARSYLLFLGFLLGVFGIYKGKLYSGFLWENFSLIKTFDFIEKGYLCRKLL